MRRSERGEAVPLRDTGDEVQRAGRLLLLPASEHALPAADGADRLRRLVRLSLSMKMLRSGILWMILRLFSNFGARSRRLAPASRARLREPADHANRAARPAPRAAREDGADSDLAGVGRSVLLLTVLARRLIDHRAA